MTYEKIGLIGFGSWVKEAYLPFINNLDTGRVTHISTRSQNSLNNAKLSFGDDAKYTLDYKSLLNDKDLDLIILSVPDEIHGDLLSDVLSVDVDCIFEMPLTLKQDDSKKIPGIDICLKDKENFFVFITL